jgi:hypothetical protein
VKLIVKLERRPIYVRSLTGPWHCLHSPGGTQTRCHVSFDPKYHPDKMAVYPPEEGFLVSVDERCGRNGCKQEFEIHDRLAEIIRKKREEIAEVFDAFGSLQFSRRTFDGVATGCAYCGVELPDEGHQRIENVGGMFDTLTCPAVKPGQIMLIRKGFEPVLA